MQTRATATKERPKAAMRIGQLSRLTGRSVHTIRWYESQHLIPGVRRDVQGRRTYVPSHVDWLHFLERLRHTGMSIRAIREYAAMVKRGDSTLEARRALLKTHRSRVELKIKDLTESLELIDSKIDFYGTWLTTGSRPPLPRKKERISR